MPRAAVAVVAVALSFHGDHRWWLLLVLALAPDLSLLGFLAGNRVGAVAYDVAQTYALPLVLCLVGVLAESGWIVAVVLVWAAHIGVDRAVGYGLKYPSAFRDTHLQRV